MSETYELHPELTKSVSTPQDIQEALGHLSFEGEVVDDEKSDKK